MTTPTNAPKGANAPSLPATDPVTPSGRRIAHLDVPTLRSCADSYRREADHLAGLGAEEAARNLIQAAEEHEARAAELEVAEKVAGGHLSPDGPLAAPIGQSPIPGTPVNHPPAMTPEVPTQAATPQEPDLSSPAGGSIDRPAESTHQHLTESTMLMMTDAPSGATATPMPIPSSLVVPPVGIPSGPSSVIPTVGVTFTEAEARAMVSPESLGLTGDAADRHSYDAVEHANAVHEAPPTTLEDAVVKLRLATSELGCGGGNCSMAGESIDQVREWLERNGTAALAGKGAIPINADPDAILLAAWEGYIAATRAYDRASEVPGMTEKDHEPFSRALFAFGDKIEETPARTMAGIAIQLRYLFAAVVESPDAAEAAIFGKAPSEALEADLEDARYRMLWRMIEEAERASAGQPTT